MTVDLTEIQEKLNKVSCPVCRHSTIDVTLRCDLGYGECLAVAGCKTCGTQYEVSTEGRILENGKRYTPKLACPGCNESEVKLEMRCELPSRQCFYVAHCEPCKHSFITKEEGMP